MSSESKYEVSLLDYGAGNVRSIRNAIEAVGFTVRMIESPADLETARVVVFPGVGAFRCAADFLHDFGYKEALTRYIRSDRPFMGICLGMQTLFDGSEEAEGAAGLGIIPGMVRRFVDSPDYSVPHIGWNGLNTHNTHTPAIEGLSPSEKVYFVHSYHALPSPANAEWVCCTTDYASVRFVSAVARKNAFATQFHPEKSGEVGLRMFRNFLRHAAGLASYEGSMLEAPRPTMEAIHANATPTVLAKRIVACLDVRTNDDGDLVVTKGDKYDVREKEERGVRNLGRPVELAARYYSEGADEIAFLNITAFRSEPLEDTPMLAVLEAASKRVFVPLTIGGGIRAYTDSTGTSYSAGHVAARYFRAGADKVSIGSDAVYAAEAFYARGGVADGSTAIEEISSVYGRQAVVVSVDPRRIYVADPTAPDIVAAGHHVISTTRPGPAGEAYCWYECTVKGGREGRPLCAYRLAKAVEALGAGELLVNCVDHDGQKSGFDEELLRDLRCGVRIPVIASSGAGCEEHFASVFRNTKVEAALAAGIFHRKEVSIADVKAYLAKGGFPVRV